MSCKLIAWSPNFRGHEGGAERTGDPNGKSRLVPKVRVKGILGALARGSNGGMSKKEIDVSCPCCGTELLVDVSSAKVLRSRHPKDEDGGDKTWSGAEGRVEERGGRARDAFGAAVDREESRESDLDDLFSKAQKKIDDRKDRDF